MLCKSIRAHGGWIYSLFSAITRVCEIMEQVFRIGGFEYIKYKDMKKLEEGWKILCTMHARHFTEIISWVYFSKLLILFISYKLCT